MPSEGGTAVDRTCAPAKSSVTWVHEWAGNSFLLNGKKSPEAMPMALGGTDTCVCYVEACVTACCLLWVGITRVVREGDTAVHRCGHRRATLSP